MNDYERFWVRFYFADWFIWPVEIYRRTFSYTTGWTLRWLFVECYIPTHDYRRDPR